MTTFLINNNDSITVADGVEYTIGAESNVRIINMDSIGT